MKERISRLSKIAAEKQKAYSEGPEAEAKLIGKAGNPPPATPPSEKEDGDDGDQEESAEAAAKRAKGIKPESNDSDLNIPEAPSPKLVMPSKPFVPQKSGTTVPLNVKPGTAQPAIVFPGK